VYLHESVYVREFVNCAVVVFHSLCRITHSSRSHRTWSRSTISEPVNPYCRPTWSSPTSVIVYPFTPCSVVPSIHRWTALVSCCSIRSLELSTTGHPVITLFDCFFVNGLKHFYFVNRFLTFYCSFTVHAFVVSVIVFI